MKKPTALKISKLLTYMAFGVCAYLPCSLFACDAKAPKAAVYDSCDDCKIVWVPTTVTIPDPTLEGVTHEITANIPHTECKAKKGKGYFTGAGSYCDTGASSGTTNCAVTLVEDGYYFTCNQSPSLSGIATCILSCGLTVAAIAATDSAALWVQILGKGGTAGLAGIACSPCDLFPCAENEGDPYMKTEVDTTTLTGTCPQNG
jgi:hypothetical protein